MPRRCSATAVALWTELPSKPTMLPSPVNRAPYPSASRVFQQVINVR